MTARRRRGDDDDLIGSVRATTAAGAAVYVVVPALSIRLRHQNQPYAPPPPLTTHTSPNRDHRTTTRSTIVPGQVFPFVDKILHDRNNSCAPLGRRHIRGGIPRRPFSVTFL